MTLIVQSKLEATIKYRSLLKHELLSSLYNFRVIGQFKFFWFLVETGLFQVLVKF